MTLKNLKDIIANIHKKEACLVDPAVAKPGILVPVLAPLLGEAGPGVEGRGQHQQADHHHQVV